MEHEQQGEQRAAYGKRVLVSLAEALSAEFGKGFSRRNLTMMRHFYILYSQKFEQITNNSPMTLNLADTVCQISRLCPHFMVALCGAYPPCQS